MSDIVDRIIGRISDAPMPTERLLDEAVSEIDLLRVALNGMLEHYVGLVNSGDAGHWDPEGEAVVVMARAALKNYRK